MAITAGEARQEILDDLGGAIGRLELASADLMEAYESLSVTAADRLEGELFRPIQKALGRGKRAAAQFAERSGLTPLATPAPAPGPPSLGPKGFVEAATTAAAEADGMLAAIQDSELFIEFGDPELRAALTEARGLLGPVPNAAREFLRRLGR